MITAAGAIAGGGDWATIRAVDILDSLVRRLPDGAVVTDSQARQERAIDCWPLALLRQVRGDGLPEPAAVVFPSATAEVATVLAWASETGTAVTPRGGGSGVCGGAEAAAGSVVLDLSRMDKVTDVDLVSRVVHVQAGVRGDQLEAALAGHGLTMVTIRSRSLFPPLAAGSRPVRRGRHPRDSARSRTCCSG